MHPSIHPFCEFVIWRDCPIINFFPFVSFFSHGTGCGFTGSIHLLLHQVFQSSLICVCHSLSLSAAVHHWELIQFMACHTVTSLTTGPSAVVLQLWARLSLFCALCLSLQCAQWAKIYFKQYKIKFDYIYIWQWIFTLSVNEGRCYLQWM